MELLLIKMKLIAHREGVQPSDPLNKAYVDNIPGILVRPSILALFLFDQPYESFEIDFYLRYS